MERATARIAKLEAELADPHLYAKDRQRFGAMSEELSQVKAELAADEDRWLELEMLRQEIEG
jgi:ATP-binding cassette subfamily F protein uup